jgi:DNA repair exonuclease SbcCD nuclease subunit
VLKGGTLRVLGAGDLHIGRRSSKVPVELDGRQYSCASAWGAVVELALTEQVDLVALSGDLVDQKNRYFEAIGPLENGLSRLAEANIDVVAVTGNHDFAVLPHVVETLGSSRFHLLGRRGEWERFTLTREGKPALHVDGRSFPQESVTGDPLLGYAFSPDGTPVLGVLHGDLDQPRSRYAPVRLDDLRRMPVAFWLLGHIHAPRLIADGLGPPVLYPGSPQAMDPGEAGVHGAWLIEFGPDGTVDQRPMPLSTMRYETVRVDLTGVEAEDAAQQLIVQAVRSALNEAIASRGPLECLSCRVVLTGRTRLHRQLPDLIRNAQDSLGFTIAGVTGVVEQVAYETRPEIDLAAFARRNDPPGEVARLIQSFEGDASPPDYRELLNATVAHLHDVHHSRPFSDVATDAEPDQSRARRYLLDEAWSLLDTLVAQKEGA